MSVKLKTKTKAPTLKARSEFDVQWPDFDSPEAMNKWLDSLPHEERAFRKRARGVSQEAR